MVLGLVQRFEIKYMGNFSTGCDLYALKFIEFHDDPPA